MAALSAATVVLAGCANLGGGFHAGFRGAVQVLLVSVFSGPSATTGAYLQNSLQVEIDGLNAAGGLGGYRLDLLTADDAQQPDRAVELVREHLLDGGVRLVVGPSSSEAVTATRPVVEQSHVPTCLPAPVADDAVAGTTLTFRTTPSQRDRLTALLTYITARTQIRRIGLIASGDGDPDGVARLLGQLAPALGVEYQGEVSVATAADPAAAVREMASRDVQGVVLAGDPSVAADAVQAAQAIGLRAGMQVFGLDELGTSAFLRRGGDAASGTVFVSPTRSYLVDAPDSDSGEAYRTFVAGVRGRYGSAAGGEIRGWPEAADCVLQWASAVRAAGTLDGGRVARAWERLRIDRERSAQGVEERFAPDRHEVLGADGLYVYQWAKQADRFRLLQLRGP